MATATVIIRTPRTQIDTIQIDAATAITHDLSSTITDHPVEDGANISDHSRPDPERVSLDCIVSATPLGGASSRVVDQNHIRLTVTSNDQDPKRPREAYDRLLKLRTDGTLITVVTPLRQYNNMAIESISIPESAQFNAATALRFSIKLKRIRIVQNKLTRTVVARPSAQGKVKGGAQVAKKADESDIDPLRTTVDTVKAGVAKVGGLF